MKALVRTWHPGQAEWHSRYEEFTRLPVAGEYLAEHSSRDWYKVGIVVHAPSSGDVEIFAVKVDDRAELAAVFGDLKP